MKSENETAPLTGRGEDSGQQRRKNDSRVDAESAMTHGAQATLHRRAGQLIAQAIFADRLASPDLHLLMESWRLIVEREADYHQRKADRLRFGGNPLDFLEDAEAAFTPRAS